MLSQSKIEEMVLQYEIEQFYFLEAALLDDRKFHEWLTLLAADLEYWMPVRETRMRAEMHLEFSQIGQAAYFDDDKEMLTTRVKKLDTGFSWSEDPPSRTRHLINNVRVTGSNSDGTYDVSSNFHIYRSRLSNDQDWWFGRRADRLRKRGDSWEVSQRHIYLDQVSLDSQNLTIFF